jgi:hypothetical protein
MVKGWLINSSEGTPDAPYDLHPSPKFMLTRAAGSISSPLI